MDPNETSLPLEEGMLEEDKTVVAETVTDGQPSEAEETLPTEEIAVVEAEVSTETEIPTFVMRETREEVIARLKEIAEEGDVSDKQELDFLKNYVEMLNYRYMDLNVIWNINEDVYKYTIIKVCLQPIVENAIFHGLALKDGEKILKIGAETVDKNVIVTIEDNGIGISEEKLKEIKDNMENDSINSKHIGMKNVYKRLRIVYNERADLKIESREGEYTLISIIVPTEL